MKFQMQPRHLKNQEFHQKCHHLHKVQLNKLELLKCFHKVVQNQIIIKYQPQNHLFNKRLILNNNNHQNQHTMKKIQLIKVCIMEIVCL
jgi:hypothetical protein